MGHGTQNRVSSPKNYTQKWSVQASKTRTSAILTNREIPKTDTLVELYETEPKTREWEKPHHTQKHVCVYRNVHFGNHHHPQGRNEVISLLTHCPPPTKQLGSHLKTNLKVDFARGYIDTRNAHVFVNLQKMLSN